ncbi:MAG TPA: type II toxin-antitoxin system HicB family antitoxin [Rhizomicrobium sp.]|jgi:predicted RNase H-like HicB family nuclease|nr:type II toxin-antitoxin system HicB family antitoxin [Rhizomicrobium sp.]
MQRFYVAVIERARKGYGVYFPDLPGCTSYGETVAEAAANALVAAQVHVALSAEHGEELPTPRAPDRIPADPDVDEEARLLVPVEISNEPVRVNISLPAAALAALDRAARELSLSRSGAIAHLALARENHTRSRPNNGLQKRRAAGKAKRISRR